MPLKLDQNSAVEKARKTHGDLYDLSEIVYTGSMGLVSVGCSKHGFFDICFRDFTKAKLARGCQACSKELYAETRAEGGGYLATAHCLSACQNDVSYDKRCAL